MFPSSSCLHHQQWGNYSCFTFISFYLTVSQGAQQTWLVILPFYCGRGNWGMEKSEATYLSLFSRQVWHLQPNRELSTAEDPLGLRVSKRLSVFCLLLVLGMCVWSPAVLSALQPTLIYILYLGVTHSKWKNSDPTRIGRALGCGTSGRH